MMARVVEGCEGGEGFREAEKVVVRNKEHDLHDTSMYRADAMRVLGERWRTLVGVRLDLLYRENKKTKKLHISP